MGLVALSDLPSPLKKVYDMLSLQTLRERVSIKQVALAMIYLLIIGVFLLSYWPTFRRGEKLRQEIAQARELEQALSKMIERRPALESQQAELEESLAFLRRSIPTQSDIPIVIQLIRDLIEGSSLQLLELDYAPLRSEENRTWFTFNLATQGGSSVLTLVELLSRGFPSLRIQNFKVQSTPQGQLGLSLVGSLCIMTKEVESQSPWQRPVLGPTGPREPVGFGLPFSIVEEFYGGKYRLLGVVITARQRYALLSTDGTEQWMQVGDRIDQGRIVRIDATGVIIDLAGVRVELYMGS